MKVIKATGLVPVKFLIGSGPYTAGETAGMPPLKVTRAMQDGLVELAPIPAGVETVEVSGPAVESIPDKKKEPAAKPEVVVIPEDWQKLHHLTQIKLACDILGVDRLIPPEGMKPSDFAEIVIAEEVKRRNPDGEGDQTSPGEKDEAGDGQNGEGDPGAGDPAGNPENPPTAAPAADPAGTSPPAQT